MRIQIPKGGSNLGGLWQYTEATFDDQSHPMKIHCVSLGGCVTVAQCKTATVRVYKGKDYKYAKMSTEKARRGAVAQWATPFMGPQFKSSSALLRNTQFSV